MKAQPRDDIEIVLNQKGFETDDKGRDHRFWYLFHNGKRTRVRTKISRGSKYKVYDISLLKEMKKQLYMDSLGQLESFIECPMGYNEYVTILINKQVIKL